MALVISLIKWHYSKALSDLFFLWKNVAWFLFHFFSISLLIRTFFSPFKRLGGGTGTFFENIIAGTLMRIVGAGCRLILIIFGLLSIFIETILAIAFFIIWLALPAVLIFFVWQGISYFLMN